MQVLRLTRAPHPFTGREEEAYVLAFDRANATEQKRPVRIVDKKARKAS